MTWDCLLLLAYAIGRRGWKATLGKIGAVVSITLLLYDVMTNLPATLSAL